MKPVNNGVGMTALSILSLVLFFFSSLSLACFPSPHVVLDAAVLVLLGLFVEQGASCICIPVFRGTVYCIFAFSHDWPLA